MNLVDVLIWVVLLIFAVKGFMKGFVREVCSFLGLAVGVWAAFLLYRPFAEVLHSHVHLPHAVACPVSFVLIFMTSGLLFFFLGHLLTTLFKFILLGGVNRAGGVVVGILQAALVLSVVLSIGSMKPVPEKVRHQIVKSASAQPFLACGNGMLSWWKTGDVSGKGAATGRISSRSGPSRSHEGKMQ